MASQTLANLLVEAADRFGDRPALATPTGDATYRELYADALHLAVGLVDAGLHPGDRVLVGLRKSRELSVAIFGTLLAGGCYVPLDYGTPAPRARAILADAQPRAVLCDARVARRLFEGLDAPVEAAGELLLCVTAREGRAAERRPDAVIPWSTAGGAAPVGRPARVGAEDLAYILYTSGSTGTPKGVCHTHASALAFVRWAAASTALSPGDVLSQHASPSFDLSVFDFFGAAAAGATLVSVPETLLGRVGRTCRWIAEERLTVWYSVPSALLREAEAGALDPLAASVLRRVVLAGEVIPKPALQRLARALPPSCRVSNWYGPTETNVCTFFDLEPHDVADPGPVPIGRPCPGATVRLSRTGTPDPDGTDGELLVHAPTTMAGYWRRPELTARAFVEDETGRRFYRTGDWAAWSRGRLLFHGRRDRLVKLRGYRVQLEEIEECLMRHPGVDEAAASVDGDAGSERVVAAVGTRAAASPEALRRHCAEALPAYMVPAEVVAVAALPRSPRGKIDHDEVAALIASRP